MKALFKYLFFLSFILLFGHLKAAFQYNRDGEYSPEKLLAESKALDEKANLALTRAVLYQQEGSLFLDSARFMNSLIKNNPSTDNIRLYINQLETHYTLAYKYIAMADSMAILAESFRDESLSKTKEAFAMMGKDVNVVYSQSDKAIQKIDIQKNTSTYMASNNIPTAKNPKPSNISSTTTNNKSAPTTNVSIPPAGATNENNKSTKGEMLYIVQLGAGNMDMKYFSKVPDIKIVNCKDGIKRYVLPVYFSKNDANKKKSELGNQGFEQIFIRTKESLDKISN